MLSSFRMIADVVPTLTVGSLEIVPNGESRTISISSDMSLDNYNAFQFDLVLPFGVTLPYNMNPDEEEMQYGVYDSEGKEN